MTPQRYQRIAEVLDRRQPDLTVLFEQVHKPHNLSAVLRTCDAVGVLDAHAVMGAGHLRAHAAIASGSAKWIRIHKHASITAAAAVLHDNDFQIVAAHPSADARDFRDLDYTRPLAILLGTEKFGVSDEALAVVDGTVSIPMAGMVASLNVSVAAAVILYEAQRQREAAGLYAHPRIDPALREELLFRWGYPRLAATYAAQGIDFPRVDVSGSIAKSAATRAR